MKLERINLWSYETAKGTRWAIEVRSQSLGGKKQLKLQRRGFLSKQEAANIGRQLRIELDTSSESQQRIRFEQFLEDYLSELCFRVQEHTRANYSDGLRRWALPTLGKKQLSQITPADISSLLSKLRSSGLRPATVNTVRQRLVGLFTYAEELQLVTTNPAKATKKYREDISESLVREPLSASEAKVLLDASKGTKLDVFIHAAILLGLRKGEIRALKWSDIDLQNGWIAIEKSRGARNHLDASGRRVVTEGEGLTKTLFSVRKAPLPVPLLQSLMRRKDALDSFNSEDDYLVCGVTGRPLGSTQLSKEFTSLLTRAGVRRIRIHDLRHTTAVLALENGVPLEQASQALGHSSVDTTKRIYAPHIQAFDESLGQALANLFETDSSQMEPNNVS